MTTTSLSEPPNLGRAWMQSTYNKELAQQGLGKPDISPRSLESLCLLA